MNLSGMSGYKAGFLNLGTIDIWGQVILYLGGGCCLVYYQMFGSIPGIYHQMPLT